MADNQHDLAIAFFSEITTLERLLQAKAEQCLPKGMEISHFAVLNHLAFLRQERSPAQLAKSLRVTRGAMSNTLRRLDWAGYLHIRPDWDDARGKWVAISPAGRQARDAALSSLSSLFLEISEQIQPSQLESLLSGLRHLRLAFDT